MNALLLAVILPSGTGPEPSILSMRLEMEDSALVTSISVEGCSAPRYPIPFDPLLMEVDLEEAWTLDASGGRREVPAWAVDTLSEVAGMPLAVVVAFPGAGARGGFLRARIRDLSGAWAGGPWLDLSVPAWADSVVVDVMDLPSGFTWSGEGFEARTVRGGTRFTGGPGPGRLVVSSLDGWDDLLGLLTADGDAILSGGMPLGVREAAIEAAAAGADPRMIVARLRTLVCNSFTLDIPSHPRLASGVRPMEEILATRTVNAYEMAVFSAAVLRSLGMEAAVLPAASSPPGVPVPSGWHRAIVRVTTGSGAVLDVEPSAYLVEAFYIPGSESLAVLDGVSGAPAGVRTAARPDSWSETWRFGEDGSFDLEIAAGGAGDSLLRRQFAGRDGGSALGSLSLWIGRGGLPVMLRDLETTDLYDLSTGVSLRASGRLADPVGPGAVLALPLVPSGTSGGVTRRWILPSAVSAASPEGVAVHGDTVEAGFDCAAPLVWMDGG